MDEDRFDVIIEKFDVFKRYSLVRYATAMKSVRFSYRLFLPMWCGGGSLDRGGHFARLDMQVM